MANSYSIAQIAPSGGVGVPARITLKPAEGDKTSVFNGAFYRGPLSGATLPAYTDPAPSGYVLIKATTFDIIDNLTYAGRYTVYTTASISDTNVPSLFSAGQTSILVNEIVNAPLPANIADATNTGSVVNVSTYLIAIAGDSSPTIIPPGVTLETRPIDLVGRNGTPWGEIFAQNFIDLAQNFAGVVDPTGPANPYLGQTWFDTVTNTFKLCTSASPVSWTVLASAVPGSNVTAKVPFVAAAGVPVTITHNLDLASPFIGLTQVFVDVGGSYKMILPQDLTFIDANNLSVTFTNAQTGEVLIRA
jgi:hypothetical protein